MNGLSPEGDEGRIEDIDKAEEMARQQNINVGLAIQFRLKAEKAARGQNPQESQNQVVKEWLKMAVGQEQLGEKTAEETGEKYDERRALILKETQKLITEVAQDAIKLQRGQLENNLAFYVISPPQEKSQQLGVSEEAFDREYRNFIYQALGVNPEEVVKAKDDFEKQAPVPVLLRTVIPNTQFRIGFVGGFGERKISEGILVGEIK